MNKEKQIEVLEDLKSYVNEEWDEYEYADDAAMMQYLTGTTLTFIKRSINTTDTVSIIILIDSPVYFNIFFIHTSFLKSKKDDTFDLCAAIISITNYYPHVHSTCHNICHSTYHNKNFLPYQLY